MVYYVLTDFGGKHYRCEDGWFAKIERGSCPPEEVRRYRTKAEATKAAKSLRKKDAFLKVLRRESVVVAARASDGAVLFEFTTVAKAKAFQRAAAKDGIETAIEVTRPAKRKVKA
jgi:hypothetical protein